MNTKELKILTPGPVAVPEFVQEAISKPVIHHRSLEFEQLYRKVQEGLKYVFQSSGPILALNGTGSLGVEAMLQSLVKPGEKALIPSNGKFSQRWADFGERKGINVIPLEKNWGERIQKDEILEKLSNHPETKALLLTHCETSTGVDLDLEEICFSVKEKHPDILILADSISTVGVIPFYFDAWKIDGAVVSSQKSLMNPTGLVFVSLSERAAAMLGNAIGEDYMDLALYYKYWKNDSFPYSAPVQAFYGIGAALEKIQSEKLPAVRNRVHILGRIFRKGLAEFGGKVFGENSGDSLTAFTFEGQDLKQIKTRLEEEYGILISEGQGQLSGKILRVAHFGAITEAMTVNTLEALSKILSSR